MDIVQNFSNSEPQDKNNVICGHEIIKNCIFRHRGNGFRSLSVPDLLAILKQLESRLRDLAYSQRDGTGALSKK